MTLSADEVRYVAGLARLALSEEEVEHLAPQLARILEYAEQVSEVATEDVPPTSHPYPLANVQRRDEPRDSLPREAVLRAAPEAVEERFAVPRIVAEEG
jgi:aspartyl-tRNA(Asn)/glutamyl-tRNA(Gln) amidotransferase subunit C